MSVLVYIGSVICVLIAILILRWLQVKSYWAKRGIPYMSPHPILGSLTFLQRLNASIWLRDLYKEFKSPYAGLWFFWKPALMINSPDLARQVLVKDARNFRNRFINSGANDPIGSLNLVTVNDPHWTDIRRQLTPTFTAAKLRNMQHFVQSKCRDLITRIEMEKGKCTDVRTMLADFTTDVVGTSAFGVESNATLTGEGHLRSITKDFMQYSSYRGVGLCCIFFFPDLVNTFGFTLFPKSTVQRFRMIFKSIVSQRQKDCKEHKDLFGSLLQIQKDSAMKGQGYSEDFIIAQAAIFLQGGFDTTAVLTTYVNLELAFHQDIQEKLYAELLEAKNKNGSDTFETSVLLELPYLKSIIKETLRKYPAMAWMDRVAKEDYMVDNQLTIKAGTPVLVNVVGMHYDPEYFPDPFKFDPDRFLPENKKNIRPFTYLPFGDGPRMCIGKRFAQMTAVQVISSIFLKYKVLPFPDTPTPTQLKTETNALFYMPGESVRLNFVPRT